MSEPIPIRRDKPPPHDLDALTEISDAVESGLGLPEVVRAAARALEASLVLIDRSSAVLAVAARSTADERALTSDVEGVVTHDLRVGDTVVGRLRLRRRSGEPPAALLRVVTTLIASEVERVRAPERATEAAQAAFLTTVLRRELTDRAEIVAGATELGIDVAPGSALIVVRTHHYAPADEDWRGRVLAAAERAARASAPGSLAAVVDTLGDGTGHVVVLLPATTDAEVRRVADAVARELRSSLHGFTFAVGHSRLAADPVDLYRAGNEALLAANVAEAGDGEAVLAFEETGAYRLLLPAMSEDPAELQRFYAETVEPLVDLRRAVRDRPRADARDLPRRRRERRRHRVAPVHAPPHDPLPARARARPDRARRVIHRRPREARPRPEGDARARHRRPARPGDRARRRGRPRAARAARPLRGAQRDIARHGMARWAGPPQVVPGSRKRTRVPTGASSSQIAPPCASTIAREIARPSPAPGVWRAASPRKNGLEDAVALVGRRSPVAGVGDLDLDAAVDVLGADGDAAVGRRVADRVLDQVEEHALELLVVAVRGAERRAAARPHRDRAGVGRRAHRLDGSSARGLDARRAPSSTRAPAPPAG